MSFLARLKECQEGIPPLLSRYLPSETTPLAKAMHYACLNGGKRLRPLLVFSAGELFGASKEALTPVALAVEFIHCYSLIHDDLPAMDNDDLRRGKPTCHKVFGEAEAILAGDALLTLAFELLSHEDQLSHLNQLTVLKIIRVLAKASGSYGMVKGQSLDLGAQGKTLSLENLMEMHRAKTGALIAASVQCGALASEAADEADLFELHNFGNAIGLCFQIKDDILDAMSNSETLGKTTGQDVKNQKCTFVTLLGIEEANAQATYWYQQANRCLERFGNKAEFLRTLSTYILERTK